MEPRYKVLINSTEYYIDIDTVSTHRTYTNK